MDKSERIELLAPAGSYEAFRAGLNAGADAFYLGGERFGARAYADNFDKEILLRTIDEAHLYEKKIYLTVNTLFKDDEADEIYDYLLPYYRQGLDAVIVQDVGILKLIRECFPDMHIHASTQMTVTGYEGAAFLESLGVKRVVPARELSLYEIGKIRENTSLEIECFAHGALCYCYSGQCLMSSFIGGRSGNRGRCAQPCRLPYKVYDNKKILSKDTSSYALNTKDICLINDIQSLIEAGITSFKIEGRMKRPEYTAGVAAIYKKYIDNYYEVKESSNVSREDYRFLESLFNRDGFSKSYFFTHNSRDMMALKNSKLSESRNKNANEAYELVKKKENKIKKHISGSFIIEEDLSVLFMLSDGIHEICCTTEADEALKRPLDMETVLKQLNKTGGTEYVFDSIDVKIKRDAFMTIGQINDLRREAFLLFEQKISQEYRRADGTRISSERRNSYNKKTKPMLSVLVSNMEQLKAVKETDNIDRLYIPYRLFDDIRDTDLHISKENIAIALSYISRMESRKDTYKSKVINYAKKGYKFLVRNLEDAALLIKNGYSDRIILDYGMYTMNRYSKEFWNELGIISDTIPVELDKTEIYNRDNSRSELIIYGRIPLMISAQCIKKNFSKCTHSYGSMLLRDRKQAEFPVLFECDRCYNIIYNSVPISLFSIYEQVYKAGMASVRLSFTIENAEETLEIINKANDILQKEIYDQKEGFSYTRGHFKRGIE